LSTHNGRPSADLMRAQAGDDWFRRNLANRAPEQKLSPVETLIIHMLDKDDGENPRRLLEIGCSRGDRLVRIATNSKIDCFGIDPSPSAVESGSTTFSLQNLKLEVGSSTLIPAADRSVDMVFFGWSLYCCNLQDFRQSMREALRVLKVGGYLAILDFDHKGFAKKTPNAHHKGMSTYRRDYLRILGRRHHLISTIRLFEDGWKVGRHENRRERLRFTVFGV